MVILVWLIGYINPYIDLWDPGSKTILVSSAHETFPRTDHKRNFGTRERVQQSCRIQDLYMKINCISIHWQQFENKIKKAIPSAIALKTITCKNLLKEVQNLYSEIYKTFWKEVKENLNKWGNIHIHTSENNILSGNTPQIGQHIQCNSRQKLIWHCYVAAWKGGEWNLGENGHMYMYDWIP